MVTLECLNTKITEKLSQLHLWCHLVARLIFFFWQIKSSSSFSTIYFLIPLIALDPMKPDLRAVHVLALEVVVWWWPAPRVFVQPGLQQWKIRVHPADVIFDALVRLSYAPHLRAGVLGQRAKEGFHLDTHRRRRGESEPTLNSSCLYFYFFWHFILKMNEWMQTFIGCMKWSY